MHFTLPREINDKILQIQRQNRKYSYAKSSRVELVQFNRDILNVFECFCCYKSIN